MSNETKQTAVDSIIEFCQKQMDNDSSIHKGVYLSIIKFCKEQITKESEIHWKTTLVTMTNNKQQTAMKLYTEADLKKVISIYSEKYKTSTDEILKELNLTPIELPSDEEIWREMETACIDKKHGYNVWDMHFFIIGSKYVIDKIQGGNK